MNTSIIPELEEQRRDALVAYYLGQVVPSSSTAAPWRITTPEDLYEYLLIDNQISTQVETSRVAQGIASIQQYIHAIYNGMEPGYSAGIETRQLDLWRNGMSEYSTWAGYQMIEDYPENYIDPTLRLGKTSQFQELEMELGQSRLTKDSVQTALKNYLSKFEVVSNLNVVSGYIDGTDFSNADYYFIGRQNVEPFSHYWRKAAISLKEGDNQVLPTAWSEWKKIDVTFEAKVTHVRGVVIDGRLHLVWVESGQPQYADNGSKTGTFSYSIKMAYKQLNDMWSPATTLHTDTTKTTDSRDPLAVDHILTTTMDIRLSPDPHLVICLQAIGTQKEDLAILAYDKQFNPVILDGTDKSELSVIAHATHQASSARLQFPYDGVNHDTGGNAQWNYAGVTWNRTHPDSYIPEGGINQSLELSATLHKPSTGDTTLILQGKCLQKKNTPDVLDFNFIGTLHNPKFWGGVATVESISYRIESLSAPLTTPTKNSIEDSLVVTVTVISRSSTIPLLKAKLRHNSSTEALISFTNMDLIHTPLPGSEFFALTFRKEILFNLKIISDLSSEEISSGAGFSCWLDDTAGSTAMFLPAAPSNRVQKTTMPTRALFKLLDNHNNPLFSGALSLNGAASTSYISVNLPEAASGTLPSYVFGFGVQPSDDPSLGFNYFNVKFAQYPRLAPTLETTDQGGQFLNLTVLGRNFQYVRLNSLFAKDFTRKAQTSLETVLSWENQHTQEPPLPGGSNRPYLDFKGANARYLWEIFFHTPHLIAHRLHTEFDYSGAEDWLNYMFNPQARIRPLFPAPAPGDEYWATRPLAEPGDPSFEVDNLRDPDAIAYSNPEHYRKTIFTFYINNLIARGDMLYRQLTRDTLNEAKLHYVRALSLLGPLSKGRSISQWAPKTLQASAKPDTSVFASLELKQLAAAPVNLPHKVSGEPWLRLLDAPWFRLPVNTVLVDMWDRLDLRLNNLRQNLTLDGKPLNLALYEPEANPKDLLRAQLAGGGSGQRRLGAMANIPPYRFRAMLPRVQNAVETLIRFGDQVRSYMEQRDRATQEELQQSHVLELSSFTEALQEQAIEQSRKSMELLEGSRAKIESRLTYYQGLLQVDVSPFEQAHMVLQPVASGLFAAANVATAVGHMLDIIPNVYGLANGGHRVSGAAYATASGIQTAAQVVSMASEALVLSEQYRRRREEWQFLHEQSEAELEELGLQINVQKVATKAAELSLAQAQKASTQAQEYFTFLKNRATGPALYQWLLSQMSTYYFQAYDVVLSLCLNTQDCWKYEIGDRDAAFIPTNAWADNRFGLTAGESLKLGLLRMEAAFLTRHERRLELTKTVSLRSLLGVTTDAEWTTLIEGIKSSGNLEFNLKASTFDKDYPGHYLRQLVSVSVSIPGLLGPYQDFKATLTQQTSDTLMAPKIEGVKYLYKKANEGTEDGESKDITFNPRAYQQIGISQGVDDRGLFSMDFFDERYYPFEGTGAISSWVLNFPRHGAKHQTQMLDSLNDIIVHVRYLAVDGGKAFQQDVEVLVEQVENPSPTPKRRLN